MKQAIKLFLLLSILTGLIYPAVVTALAQLALPEKANGSLIYKDGVLIGSKWLEQPFSKPAYFWPRPSAVSYNPLPSGGSNLSRYTLAIQKQMAEKAGQSAEMIFASGSGLDPHISPEAALAQIDRVAEARKLTGEKKVALRTLVQGSVEPRDMGVFGEPRVNVLLLNLAVDSAFANRR